MFFATMCGTGVRHCFAMLSAASITEENDCPGIQGMKTLVFGNRPLRIDLEALISFGVSSTEVCNSGSTMQTYQSARFEKTT